MKGNIHFIGKDQFWQNETTNYWFSVDGQEYAISDCNGFTSLLDCEGFLVGVDFDDIKLLLMSEYERLLTPDPAEAYHDHLAFEADDKNDHVKLYS